MICIIIINNDKITYGISQASSSFNTWRNKYMPISEINLDKFNDTKDNVEVRDMYKILKYDMVKLRYDDKGYSHIFFAPIIT